MIVWGGYGPEEGYLNDCGIYNPSTNSWRAVGASNPPLGRTDHSVVWTGSEMIVWGGSNGGYSNLNDGGRYNPVTHLWTRISETDAPAGRSHHQAIWTGTEMLIWGGSPRLTDTPSYKPGQNLYLYQRP
jgi:N-acetylneuraminic acid mutarotase